MNGPVTSRRADVPVDEASKNRTPDARAEAIQQYFTAVVGVGVLLADALEGVMSHWLRNAESDSRSGREGNRANVSHHLSAMSVYWLLVDGKIPILKDCAAQTEQHRQELRMCIMRYPQSPKAKQIMLAQLEETEPVKMQALLTAVETILDLEATHKDNSLFAKRFIGDLLRCLASRNQIQAMSFQNRVEFTGSDGVKEKDISRSLREGDESASGKAMDSSPTKFIADCLKNARTRVFAAQCIDNLKSNHSALLASQLSDFYSLLIQKGLSTVENGKQPGQELVRRTLDQAFGVLNRPEVMEGWCNLTPEQRSFVQKIALTIGPDDLSAALPLLIGASAGQSWSSTDAAKALVGLCGKARIVSLNDLKVLLDHPTEVIEYFAKPSRPKLKNFIQELSNQVKAPDPTNSTGQSSGAAEGRELSQKGQLGGPAQTEKLSPTPGKKNVFTDSIVKLFPDQDRQAIASRVDKIPEQVQDAALKLVDSSRRQDSLQELGQRRLLALLLKYPRSETLAAALTDSSLRTALMNTVSATSLRILERKLQGAWALTKPSSGELLPAATRARTWLANTASTPGLTDTKKAKSK